MKERKEAGVSWYYSYIWNGSKGEDGGLRSYFSRVEKERTQRKFKLEIEASYNKISETIDVLIKSLPLNLSHTIFGEGYTDLTIKDST